MKFDVLISGGGVVGITTALSLESLGLKVGLMVKHHESMMWSVPDGKQIYMLNGGSVNFLKKLGVWNLIAKTSIAEVSEIVILGDRQDLIGFNALGENLSALGYTIEKNELIRALHKKLTNSNLIFRHNIDVESLDTGPDQISVQLSDGEILKSDLLVGADSINSRIRKLAKIGSDTHDFQQIALVFRIRAQHGGGIAYQWFRHEGEVLALLPLADNQFGVVWSVSKKRGENLLRGGKRLASLELRSIVSHHVGECKIVDEFKYFPITSLKPNTVIGDRLVLVGDAAGTIHPMAGQGLNLGIRDALILSKAVGGDKRGSMHCKLRSYERRRAEKVAIMSCLTRGLHELFCLNGVSVSFLRGMGFSIFEKTQILKKLALNIASN
ncbi:MAG: hypothetical protein CMK56_03285 [Proteobacteria bacterium]|nr:hypothetical protein [Pseudomonadota bacterium]